MSPGRTLLRAVPARLFAPGAADARCVVRTRTEEKGGPSPRRVEPVDGPGESRVWRT